MALYCKNYEKKLGSNTAFVCSLIFTFTIWFVLVMPCLHRLSLVGIWSIDDAVVMVRVSNASLETDQSIAKGKNSSENEQIADKPIQNKPMLCNLQDPRSDFCEMNGDVRVQGSSATIVIANTIESGANGRWSIRPYARKDNAAAMQSVRNWSIHSFSDCNNLPLCSINHSIPAILFSLRGFSGNHFHDFSDLLIPLYVTSCRFNKQVQFLVTNNRPWWINKFQGILNRLSNHRIINIDKETKTHCYPSITAGLKCHGELRINQSKSPNGESMKQFRQFLRSTYSLNRTKAVKLKHGTKPRLMIITRRKSRSFTNKKKIIKLARTIGYETISAEANHTTNLSNFAKIVNSCDVLLGVHGAGLTNMVFLPDNAIVIQIIPFGGIEGLSKDYFELPAKDMKLRYLDYKIKVKESSLFKQLNHDDIILRDPLRVHRKGWEAVKSTFMERQNVKIDVHRFRPILLKAFKLLHH